MTVLDHTNILLDEGRHLLPFNGPVFWKTRKHTHTYRSVQRITDDFSAFIALSEYNYFTCETVTLRLLWFIISKLSETKVFG